jgi:signal peptidase
LSQRHLLLTLLTLSNSIILRFKFYFAFRFASSATQTKIMLMPKTKDLIVDIIFYSAVTIFVTAIVGTLIAKNLGHDLYFFGYKPFFISSESMAPDFLRHSLVIIKKSNYAQAQVGDVIAFKPALLAGQFALHRVIDQNERGLITKGDNNNMADLSPVSATEFVGQYVWHTNLTAHLSAAVSQHGVLKVVILPLVAIIFAFAAASLTVSAVFGGKEE